MKLLNNCHLAAITFCISVLMTSCLPDTIEKNLVQPINKESTPKHSTSRLSVLVPINISTILYDYSDANYNNQQTSNQTMLGDNINFKVYATQSFLYKAQGITITPTAFSTGYQYLTTTGNSGYPTALFPVGTVIGNTNSGYFWTPLTSPKYITIENYYTFSSIPAIPTGYRYIVFRRTPSAATNNNTNYYIVKIHFTIDAGNNQSLSIVECRFQNFGPVTIY